MAEFLHQNTIPYRLLLLPYYTIHSFTHTRDTNRPHPPSTFVPCPRSVLVPIFSSKKLSSFRILDVTTADVLPLFLETWSVPCMLHIQLKARTPLFQVSQNCVIPRSKPTLSANAPAKIVGTKTPVGQSVQPSPAATRLLRQTYCYASQKRCRTWRPTTSRA